MKVNYKNSSGVIKSYDAQDSKPSSGHYIGIQSGSSTKYLPVTPGIKSGELQVNIGGQSYYVSTIPEVTPNTSSESSFRCSSNHGKAGGGCWVFTNSSRYIIAVLGWMYIEEPTKSGWGHFRFADGSYSGRFATSPNYRAKVKILTPSLGRNSDNRPWGQYSNITTRNIYEGLHYVSNSTVKVAPSASRWRVNWCSSSTDYNPAREAVPGSGGVCDWTTTTSSAGLSDQATWGYQWEYGKNGYTYNDGMYNYNYAPSTFLGVSKSLNNNRTDGYWRPHRLYTGIHGNLPTIFSLGQWQEYTLVWAYRYFFIEYPAIQLTGVPPATFIDEWYRQIGNRTYTVNWAKGYEISV